MAIRHFATVDEIIKYNLARIAQDLKEIPGLISIDFMDIFPMSEDHRKALDEEMKTRAVVLQVTERGNVYVLNTPLASKVYNVSKK